MVLERLSNPFRYRPTLVLQVALADLSKSSGENSGNIVSAGILWHGEPTFREKRTPQNCGLIAAK